MRVLFFSAGATGSGHIVRGLSVAAALRRAGLHHDYAILTTATPYAELARRLGVPIQEIPFEMEEASESAHYRDSRTFMAISAFNPDILIVDMFWLGLHASARELPCRKVLLTFQFDPAFYHIRTPNNDFRFRPEDYDLLLRTEPGYAVPFEATEINPMVLRNHDEILGKDAARADLGLENAERSCLFACSGESGQVEAVWKSFSYLQDEGWTVYRAQHREGGLFPTIDWFAAFELLVCGAGYNAFWEARWMRKEAFFVPFPRLREDQARRPALFSDYQVQVNGADQLVGMLTSL